MNEISDVKRRLVGSDDFEDAVTDFYKMIERDPSIMARGSDCSSPLVESAVRALGLSLFGEAVRVERIGLRRIPEHSLIHGCFEVNGRMTMVLFFEDVQCGGFCTMPAGRSREVTVTRFRTGMTSGPSSFEPSPN